MLSQCKRKDADALPFYVGVRQSCNEWPVKQETLRGAGLLQVHLLYGFRASTIDRLFNFKLTVDHLPRYVCIYFECFYLTVCPVFLAGGLSFAQSSSQPQGFRMRLHNFTLPCMPALYAVKHQWSFHLHFDETSTFLCR